MCDCTTFIDYDDTLFPTTEMATLADKQGISISELEISDAYMVKMNTLQDKIIELFKAIKYFGNICILTNASLGWITESLERYMPKIYKMYKKSSIKVISASHESLAYNENHNNNPKDWKYYSMTKYLQNKNNHYIISIGDSMYEADASSEIKYEIGLDGLHYNSPRNIYTIKFSECSNIDGLILQLDKLTREFENILTKCHNSEEIHAFLLHENYIVK